MKFPIKALILLYLAQGAPAMAGIADLFVYFPSNQEFNRCPHDFTPKSIATENRPLRYYEKKGPSPEKIVLYFHGNAGSACDRLPLISGFDNSERFHFAFAEYSGYSNDSGPRSEAAFTEDAIALYDKLKSDTGLPIIVFGRSLGSTVATYLASQRDVHSLILVSPLTSIIEVGRLHYPIPKFISRVILKNHKFDATQWAPQVKSPVLIIQGDQDNIVPYSMAKTQSSNFTATKVRFQTVPGAEHNDIAAFEKYQTGLNAFLKNPHSGNNNNL